MGKEGVKHLFSDDMSCYIGNLKGSTKKLFSNMQDTKWTCKTEWHFYTLTIWMKNQGNNPIYRSGKQNEILRNKLHQAGGWPGHRSAIVIHNGGQGRGAPGRPSASLLWWLMRRDYSLARTAAVLLSLWANGLRAQDSLFSCELDLQRSLEKGHIMPVPWWAKNGTRFHLASSLDYPTCLDPCQFSVFLSVHFLTCK